MYKNKVALYEELGSLILKNFLLYFAAFTCSFIEIPLYIITQKYTFLE